MKSHAMPNQSMDRSLLQSDEGAQVKEVTNCHFQAGDKTKEMFGQIQSQLSQHENSD
jgi:hypothetical protein